MSEKSLPPQFQAAVQLLSAVGGLSLAFKQKYGDEALEVTRSFAEQMGLALGSEVKKKGGVTGSDIHAVEQVMRAWLEPMMLGPSAKIEVEGNKLTLTRESPTECPMLYVSKQLKVPIETLCNNISTHVFGGVAKSVNPNAKYSSLQMSEQKCVEQIEIP